MNCRHRAQKISGTKIRNEFEETGSLAKKFAAQYCDPAWKALTVEVVGRADVN